MKNVLAALFVLGFLLSQVALGEGVSQVPPPTDGGSFEGTWYYADPAYNLAIFISKDKTGLLQIRYHLQAHSKKGFETDAGGYAKAIDDEGNLVRVLFTGSASGPNLITGHYERTVEMKKKGSMKQVADFKMYLTEGGRKLVLLYPEFRVETTDAKGRTTTSVETDVFKLFRKASDIVVDFDEIAF